MTKPPKKRTPKLVEQPEDPFEELPLRFSGIDQHFLPNDPERVIRHAVVSEDFMLVVSDLNNLQFAFADDSEVKVYFHLGEPRELILNFPLQADAREFLVQLSKQISVAKEMEAFHVQSN